MHRDIAMFIEIRGISSDPPASEDGSIQFFSTKTFI
jgi:hypothetical protein